MSRYEGTKPFSGDYLGSGLHRLRNLVPVDHNKFHSVTPVVMKVESSLMGNSSCYVLNMSLRLLLLSQSTRQHCCIHR